MGELVRNMMNLEAFEKLEFSEIPVDLLMERKEKKFCFHTTMVPSVLQTLQKEFAVLQSNGRSIQHYESSYLDTIDSALYLSHHNQRRERYKLRFRNYLNGEMSFFEIKCKNNKNKTIKTRLELDFMMNEMTDEVSAFIEANSNIEASNLLFSINTKYDRISFIEKHKRARITLDLHPEFTKENKTFSLEKIAIMELKYDVYFPINTWQRRMKNLGILPHKMSKYCVGMCLANPTLKHNSFKPILRILNDLQITN